MAHDVIMPALGMTQETGLILAWRKKPGDAVKAGEILMEVETDKAAMEVEAQADGFLTEIRAGEGEEVPVGEVIAVISASKDDVRSAPEPKKKTAAGQSQPMPAAAVSATDAAFSAKSALSASEPVEAPLQPVNGRILASPKAKRLAAERGLDLARLAKTGHPQPFHVADLDKLAAMLAPGPSMAMRQSRASARVAAEAFDQFVTFAAEEADASIEAVLAMFAAGSLRATTGTEAVTIAVLAPHRRARLYADPDWSGLARLTPLDAERDVDLIVYDLTGSRLTYAEFAAGTAPTLAVARDGDTLQVSLSVTPDKLDGGALIACLNAFARRLEEPLRQLV